MRDVLFLSEARKKNQFRIDYPYYGLFGTADVTPVDEAAEVVYKCRLLNGSIVFLKKLLQQQRWIDVNLNIETPLSSVLGSSIDDFLRTAL
jgi:hypothetical protein